MPFQYFFMFFFFLLNFMLDAVFALGCRPSFVNGIIVAFKSKKNLTEGGLKNNNNDEAEITHNFVVDTKPPLQSLSNLEDRLLRFGLAEPHGNFVSSVSHIHNGTINYDAFSIK